MRIERRWTPAVTTPSTAPVCARFLLGGTCDKLLTVIIHLRGRLFLGGLVLDVVIAYLIKSALRLRRLWGSSRWPAVQARVDSSWLGGSWVWNCPTAEIAYTYEFAGQTYSASPFTQRPFQWVGASREIPRKLCFFVYRENNRLRLPSCTANQYLGGSCIRWSPAPLTAGFCGNDPSIIGQLALAPTLSAAPG